MLRSTVRAARLRCAWDCCSARNFWKSGRHRNGSRSHRSRAAGGRSGNLRTCGPRRPGSADAQPGGVLVGQSAPPVDGTAEDPAAPPGPHSASGAAAYQTSLSAWFLSCRCLHRFQTAPAWSPREAWHSALWTRNQPRFAPGVNLDRPVQGLLSLRRSAPRNAAWSQGRRAAHPGMTWRSRPEASALARPQARGLLPCSSLRPDAADAWRQVEVAQSGQDPDRHFRSRRVSALRIRT